MIQCCSGSTLVVPNGVNAWSVLCGDCDRVLATTRGPRSEVYADL